MAVGRIGKRTGTVVFFLAIDGFADYNSKALVMRCSVWYNEDERKARKEEL